MFRNEKKRFLSLMLALLMLISVVPLDTFAASGTVFVLDEQVSIAYSGNTASATVEGNTVTATTQTSTEEVKNLCGDVTGYNYNSETNTLTIKNNSGSQQRLAFNYSFENCQSFTIDSDIISSSGSYEENIAAGGTITLAIESYKDVKDSTATLTLSNFQFKAAETEYLIKFEEPEHGSFTVDDKALSSLSTTDGMYSVTTTTTKGVKLSATAESGYVFFGWLDQNNRILSRSAIYTFPPKENCTVHALFTTNADAIARYGAGPDYSVEFIDLQKAIDFAVGSTSKNVTLLTNATIAENQNITVHKGVTLLIPFDDENTLYRETPENTGYTGTPYVNATANAYVTPSEYRTLTMLNGSSITVNGELSISAKHSSGPNAGQATAGSPSGECGYIKMESGSEIIVNGSLYAWGFIYGSGKVTANGGSKIYENFQFTDFRGGTATTQYASNKKVFPLSQYYVQNIEVPTTFNYGAEEHVYTSVYMSKNVFSGTAVFVGTGGMFIPEEGGTITKTYLSSSDRLLLETSGSATIRGIELSLGGTDINSSEFVLPLNGNISVKITNGTTTLSQNIALLPGVKMTIEEGATLDIVKNDTTGNESQLYIYDRDEWYYGYTEGKYDSENPEDNYVDDPKYVHPNIHFKAVAYSPTRSYTRKDSDLKDVVFDINGTVSLNEGSFYTTLGGASITSTGKTGKITYSDKDTGESDSVTLQGNQNSSNKPVYYDIPVTSAQLKNADGSYTETANAETESVYSWYETYEGKTLNRWAKECTVTWKNEDGSVIVSENQVPSGTAPTYEKYTRTKASKTETIPLPTKEKDAQYTYEFYKWLIDGTDSETYVSDTTTVESLKETYTATFTPIERTYTVQWVTEEEDGTTTIHHTEEVPYGNTPTQYSVDDYGTPTKKPIADVTYKFTDWDSTVKAVTEDNLSEEEIESGIITYTAIYDTEVHNYTVEWVTVEADGSVTTHYTETVKYGGTPEGYSGTPEKQATAEFTYTFSNWDKEIVAITKENIAAEDIQDGIITYTAQYTEVKNSYTVVWQDEDGTELARQTLEYGTTPVYSGTPTKEATAQYTYKFAGWKNVDTGAIGLATVTGDVTYIATYTGTVNKYTVVWKNGSSTVETDADVEYGTTPSYDGATPTKTSDAQYDYTFTGWTKEGAPDTAVPEFTISETVTGNVTYIANFEGTVRSYTVTWKNEDGTVLESESWEYGSTPSYGGETPTKAADAQYTYEFADWDKTIGSVTGNVTYTATYNKTVNKYTVTWKNEDGTVLEVDGIEDDADNRVAYGDMPSYNGETPTKAKDEKNSYTFSDWKAENAENAGLTTVTGDVTYIATYSDQINKYTVIWENEDGTELYRLADVEYGTTPTYEGETPEKASTAQYEYKHTGWDREVNVTAGTITYTATYTPTVREYIITWKNYDGTILEDNKAWKYGETPTYDGTPTRSAITQYTYEFIGWTPEVKEVTGEATYTAQYKAVTRSYTVTWKDEDGTVLESKSWEYGLTPAYNGETPTKAADAQYTYTFAGWKKDDADDNTAVKEITETVKGDVTYTAVYEKTVNTYTITWENEDGKVLDEQTLAYDAIPVYQGSVAPEKEQTTELTFTFAEWKNAETGEIGLAAVTGDATYVATYTSNARKYTITWENEDGSSLGSDRVAYGDTPSYTGETPKKDANVQYTYTFADWKNTETGKIGLVAVTGDATYTATYTGTTNTYTVIWKNANGEVLETDTDVAYGTLPNYDGETPKQDADAQYTYTFKAWTPEVSEISDDTVIVNGEIIYTATYDTTVNTYTVTWLNHDGSLLETDENVPYGEKPSYDGTAPEKSEDDLNYYRFEGKWSPEITEDTIVTGDVEYTAQFLTVPKGQYTITFNSNGGTSVATMTLLEGAEITAPEAPTKTGYTFDGWYPELPDEMPAENLEVTAQWKVNSYSITFDPNNDGESEKTVITKNYGEAIEAPANPTREGYTFAGWDTEIPGTMPAENMTITAEWTINQYTITFDTDGGTAVDSITKNYGEAITAPDEPTKKGYTFTGWDTEIPETMPAGNMTITAEWTINQYTITFDTDGGTAIESITADYGTAIEAPADPTKEGYDFDGWDITIPETMPAGNVTITAKWKINSYTITFNTNGGNKIDSITAYYGEVITAPADPTREGYTFDGWDTKIPGTMPAGNMTITANWTINQYTITFDTDGGTAIESITADYGTAITVPADPTKTGYTFVEWDTEIPGTMPAEDMTITAKWRINQYKITFDTAGGNAIAAISQNYDTVVEAPADPVRTGYTFTGWDQEIPERMPAENMTITAQWEINSYKITFDTDGGTPVASITQEYGTAVTKPADPTKTGYTFAGWNITIPDTMPAKNLEAKALWTVNQYTINFNTDGGTAIAPITANYGTAITKPADPTKAGYTFAGWDTTIPETMPAGNMTITAQWTTNQYTITFDTDGGSEIASITQDYGTAVTAPANPTKAGYTFAGWDVKVPTTMPAEDLTITAKWTINQYTITFNTDGGSNVDEITQDYGTVITAPENPTKKGYTFAGWDIGVPEKMPAENLTITAQWTINQYTITFNTDGGSEVKSITQDYNTVITDPADPTKEGYTFAGWEPEIPLRMPANDTTIKAQWTINQYTITFDTDGGSDIESITQNYNTAIVAPADPIKTGYTFAGWDKEIPETMPAGSITIKALWTINQYEISWDTDGDGVVDDVTSVNYNETPTHENGSKEADAQYTYTFKEWSPAISPVTDHITYTAQFTKTVNKYTISWDTDGDGIVDETTSVAYGSFPVHADGKKATDGMYEYTFTDWDQELTVVDGEKTYTAQFSKTPVKYTLTYDTDGGTSIGQFVVGYGEAITKPADPEKTGYTFIGWDKEIPETMPAENVVITAQWQINQYTITFDINGGETGEIAPITQDYATAVTAPADPEKTGYTFIGWSPALPATMPADDMTVTAQWRINQYTITYDTDGGSEVKSVTEDYGTKLPLPEEPTKEGHTFIGWDIETPRNMPAYNMTITAQWKVNEYTLTFVTEDGEEPYATVTQDYGTDIKFPEDPEKEGYIFGGWSPEIGSKMPAEDMTLEAVWNINQYTITFDTDGGNLINAITADYDAKITAPSNPRKTGYTFVGWDQEIPERMPAENMTIKALWEVNQYTIHFDTDGGSEIAPITQDYGTVITIPENPTKTGHSFAGWDINIPARMPATDLYATALWYINEYTITFNTNGGTEIDPITAYYEEYIEMPAEEPTKEGYAFAGWDQEFPETMPAGGLTLNAQWVALDYAISWDLDGDGTVDEITMEPYDSVPTHEDGAKAPILEYSYQFTGWSPEITTVKGSAAYTAQFEAVPNEFTIHFDTDGGTEVEDMTCAYGSAASEPEAPTKEGYTFTGWSPALPESMPAENITVVAQWKVNEYTIHFDTDGGSDIDSITSGYGSAVSQPSDPVKEGYTFVGWDIEFPDTMGSEDVILKAQWQVNQYTINFDTAGGSEVPSITQDYGTAIIEPEPPVRENYEFIGWNIDIPDTMQANNITITAQWKFIYTGWFDEEDGTTYLIRGEKEYYNTWAEIDGNSYFFDADSYIVKGLYNTTSADGTFKAYFIFDEETGIFQKDRNGLYDYKGNSYLAKDGYLREYPGLVKIGDDYYYFNSSSVAIKGCKYWITKTNGLMLKGSYTFDETGKITNPAPFSDGEERDGIVEVDGTLCYFKDGDLYYAGLIKVDGAYYYVKSTGALARNEKYWVTKTNGLMPQASYQFDENGKITNPKVYPTAVTLSQNVISVNKGKTYSLKATVESDVENAEVVSKVTWTTSDKRVATVSSSGRITAVNKGTATITVTTANGMTASCEVTVLIPATKVTLNKTSLTINAGKTYTLKATMTPRTTTDTLTWVSSDESVVTVSEDGKVTAVAAGKATITVTTTSGKKAVCKITVK